MQRHYIGGHSSTSCVPHLQAAAVHHLILGANCSMGRTHRLERSPWPQRGTCSWLLTGERDLPSWAPAPSPPRQADCGRWMALHSWDLSGTPPSPLPGDGAQRLQATRAREAPSAWAGQSSASSLGSSTIASKSCLQDQALGIHLLWDTHFGADPLALQLGFQITEGIGRLGLPRPYGASARSGRWRGSCPPPGERTCRQCLGLPCGREDVPTPVLGPHARGRIRGPSRLPRLGDEPAYRSSGAAHLPPGTNGGSLLSFPQCPHGFVGLTAGQLDCCPGYPPPFPDTLKQGLQSSSRPQLHLRQLHQCLTASL